MTKKRQDRDAREAIEQLEMAFPGVIALAQAKSMDAVIYPERKPPHNLINGEAAALTVSKGLHVADALRRKA